MKFGAMIAKWAKGVATAFSELTKVQMAIVGTTAVVAVSGIGVGSKIVYDQFHQPEAIVADAEAETETMTEEQEKTVPVITEGEQVTLVGSSIERDLKIKIQDEHFTDVKGQPFSISIVKASDGEKTTDKSDDKSSATKSGANTSPAKTDTKTSGATAASSDSKDAQKDENVMVYEDDDQDGIIYIKKIEAGDYLVSLDEIEGYYTGSESILVTVKDKIEYKKVDVVDEIKKESEVSAAEDVMIEDNVEVEAVIQDTVALLGTDCKSTAVSGANVDMSKFGGAAAASGESKAELVRAVQQTASVVRNSIPLVGTGTGGTQTEGTEGGNEGGSTETISYKFIHKFSDKQETVEETGTGAKDTEVTAQKTFDGYTTESTKTHTIGETGNEWTITWVKNSPTTYDYKFIHKFSDKQETVEETGSGAKGAEVTAQKTFEGYTTASTKTYAIAETGNEWTIEWTKTPTSVNALYTIPSSATIYTTGATSLALKATISDESKIIKSVAWESADSKIVTVSDASAAGCTIKAVAAGTANVKATITYLNVAGDDTKTATKEVTCAVTVKAADATAPLYDTSGARLYIDDKCTKPATVANYSATGTYYKDPKYTGWWTLNGNVYYYDSNYKPVTGKQVISGITYNFDSNGVLQKTDGTYGIDVSKYQGKIDWNAVAAAGIKFAIIRCGYRGGLNGQLIEDPYYRTNIKGATAAGIKVGVYFFTQAVTEAEAVEEASMVLSLVSGYRLSYPIFVDTENGVSGARANGLDVNTRTACVAAFCKTIANSGYTAGIYASKNWYGSKLNMSALNSYCIWVAQYNTTCTYTGRYSIWQYSSKGCINGINGYVDLNVSYM